MNKYIFQFSSSLVFPTYTERFVYSLNACELFECRPKTDCLNVVHYTVKIDKKKSICSMCVRAAERDRPRTRYEMIIQVVLQNVVVEDEYENKLEKIYGSKNVEAFGGGKKGFGHFVKIWN